MKLSVLLLLSLIATTAFVHAQDENDDVEIDDDEAEIEDDEDLEEELDDDEVDDSDEPTFQESDQPSEPHLMSVPLAGIRSFAFFPEGAHSITGGKMSEMVIGVQNNGEEDMEMVSCNGRMSYPQTGEVVQNFTNIGYENQAVSSKSEASFSYGFVPHVYTGGRDFDFTIEVYYKKAGNSNMYYKATPFNETVSVLESTEGVATEIACLWLTVAVLLVIGAFVVYKKFLIKWLGLKPAANTTKKIETGTINNDVDMSWIPEGHKKKSDDNKGIRKRTASPAQ